jgi:phosphoglycerate dehydrogenase-like enzyme
MDRERRALIAAKAAGGAFEPLVLDDVPASQRAAAWESAEVLVCTGFGNELPPDLPSRSPRLKMIQTILAGVDHLPFERLPASAIVCSNAGAYNTSVAEHAMALLLAAAKDVGKRTEEIRRGLFDQSVMNKALAGSTVLLLGMGGIGSEVARLCKAFRMHTIGLSRSRPRDPALDEAGTIDELPGFLPRADFLVLALPLTRQTAGLVDRAFLAAMKPDAVLVNIARGKIILEDDLFEHLRTHPGFRAALDVWWTYPDTKQGRPFHRPFHELPNVLMTPHLANAIPSQRREAMEAALDNVLRFLRGETPRHIVRREEYARAPAKEGSR